jgi:molybdenum cofactor cytidylyltransferase
MSDIGLILLAAGGSTRMGRAKQLLVFKGRSLLRRAAEEGVASGCRPVVVVLGDRPEEMRGELAGLEVQIVVNDRWRVGMGASIRRGMEEVQGAAVVVMLCDQPFVTAEVIGQLIKTFRESGKAVCASSYAGTFGPPCLFAASEFERLRGMPEEQGAKRLIAAAADVALVPFEKGAVDVDTVEDYERILNEEADERQAAKDAKERGAKKEN